MHEVFFAFSAAFLRELCGKAFVFDLHGDEIMKTKSRLFVLALIMMSVPASLMAQGQGTSFDLVVTHGHIIDGTGSPWYSGDVGIRGGKIAAIGNLAAAPRKRTID